jgi:LPS export ABC transporter protein LptC
MNFYHYGNRVYIFIISIIILSSCSFVFLNPFNNNKSTHSENSVLINELIFYQTDKKGNIYKIASKDSSQYKDLFIFNNPKINTLNFTMESIITSDIAKLKIDNFIEFIDNVKYNDNINRSLFTSHLFYDIINGNISSDKNTVLKTDDSKILGESFKYNIESKSIYINKVKASFF